VSDREAILKFAEALGSRDAALRRDECGDPRIEGRRGHIYAVPGGFMLYAVRAAGDEGTSHWWTNTKAEMAFAKVKNDGDAEGAFFLDRLPTAAEAGIIRARLLIPKKAEYSDEVLARKRAGMIRARSFLAEPDGDREKPPNFAQEAQGEGEKWPDRRRGADTLLRSVAASGSSIFSKTRNENPKS
jgi:hypothetical protein